MLAYIIQLNNRVEEGNRENEWIDTQPKAKTFILTYIHFSK